MRRALQTFTLVFPKAFQFTSKYSVIKPTLMTLFAHGFHRLLLKFWYIYAIWHVAWWCQAVTWTSVDALSIGSRAYHMETISQEVPQPPITILSLKITYLKFKPPRYQCVGMRGKPIAFLPWLPRWHTSFPCFQFASYQIHKFVGCACTGNAGNVSPATDFKENH